MLRYANPDLLWGTMNALNKSTLKELTAAFVSFQKPVPTGKAAQYFAQ